MQSIVTSKLTLQDVKKGSVLVHSGKYSWIHVNGTCNGFQGQIVESRLFVVRLCNGVLVCGFKCRHTGTIGAKLEFKTIKALKAFLIER